MKKKEKYLPSEEENWEPFSDYTKDFYKFLKVPNQELFQGSPEERVKQILIIIAGTMGIGKTKLVENIIQKLRKYYTEEKTNVVYTKVSTKALIEYGFKGNPLRGWNSSKPVQIIVFDDATSVSLSKKDQRQFCSLRHKMMEETGLTEGIIYSILVTHDWYRLDPNFRRNALVTCFLSVSPLDQYSRREYGKFLGKAGVEFLAEKLSKSIKFDKEKGTGLVVLPFKPNKGNGKVGRIKWKNLTGIDYIEIKELPSKRLYFSRKIKRKKNGSKTKA